MPVDFRHLETFCRVADLKNFSKAAEDLFLTQPTVSGHILSLERSLGLRLFDRMGREARLTKAGEVLYRHAQKILTSRKEALNALSEFSDGIRGELSMGASTIPGEYLLPKLIGDFKKEYPQILISLKIADTKGVVQYMLQGSIEFGMTGAKLNHPSLQYEFFGEDEIIIVSAPKFLDRWGEKMSLVRILKEPWIIREEGSGTQIAVEKALRKKGSTLKEFNVAMEMGSTSSVKEGVKAGLGLAFISKKAVEDELKSGSLCRISLDGIKPISRPIYAVFHRGKTLSPMGERFLRFLRDRKGSFV